MTPEDTERIARLRLLLADCQSLNDFANDVLQAVSRNCNSRDMVPEFIRSLRHIATTLEKHYREDHKEVADPCNS